MKRSFSILFIIGAFAFAFVQLAPLLRESAEDRRLRWAQNVVPPRQWAAQPPEPGGFDVPPQPRFGGPRFGGFRRGPNFGNAAQPPVQTTLKLLSQFDQDGDGWLNAEERKAAREYLDKERAAGRLRRAPALRPQNSAPDAGPKVNPAAVKTFADGGLYDTSSVRTLFVEFEDSDWEKELADFANTDIAIPAKLEVDGKSYPGSGIQLRQTTLSSPSSSGRRQSLTVALDLINRAQNLSGFRTLDLFSSHEDPGFLRSVLYLQAARDYIPTPKASFARLAMNRETWGIYVNVQPFNKDFTKEWFDSSKGARWQVLPRARGKGAFEYLGEHAGAYREIYELKSKEDNKAWHALIALCRILNETPTDQLERELSPLLDIEGTLKLLAVENALVNTDGYWLRGGGENLYLDANGRFHLIPAQTNEALREPVGPGWSNSARAVELDPLRGADDPSRPLLQKLLAVTALREKFLTDIREVALRWLDWKQLGALIEQYQAQIAEDINSDPRKLYTAEAFARFATDETEQPGPRGPEKSMSLKSFVEQRQAFLLNHPLIRELPGAVR